MRRLSQGTSSHSFVQFYDAYETSTHYALIMEQCEDDTLLGRLRRCVDERRQPFSEREALVVMAQLLRAVAAMHNAGVVHRDVKCENVLFARFPTAVGDALRLCDFGDAAWFHPATPAPFRGRAGTERYMAPEVLQGCYGPPADVFACGVIMHFILTAQLPFATQLATQRGKLDASLLRHLSPEAIELLLALLQRLPQARCTAAQAPESRWILAGADSASAVASTLDIGVAQRMRRYAQANPVKQSLLLRLAGTCSHEELRDLQRQFRCARRTALRGRKTLCASAMMASCCLCGMRSSCMLTCSQAPSHLDTPRLHGVPMNLRIRWLTLRRVALCWLSPTACQCLTHCPTARQVGAQAMTLHAGAWTQMRMAF